MTSVEGVEATRGLTDRLLSRNAGILLARNTLVSCAVFALNLALLWLLVEHYAVDTILAAGIGFIAANSLHYVFGRAWIYRGTTRAVASGYFYFLVNALVGLTITLGLFAAFLALMPIHYLAARIIVSVFAGLAMFLLNAMLNFRRL